MGSISLRNEILQAARTETTDIWDLSVVKEELIERESNLHLLDVEDFDAYHQFLNSLLISCFYQKKFTQYNFQVDEAFLSKGRLIWSECQLFQLYHAIIDYISKGSITPLSIVQVSSGATPIEAEGWLSWLNSPSAGLHEELGMLLAFYGYLTENQEYLSQGAKLVEWQKQLIQGDGLPLTELFSNEGRHAYKNHLARSYALYLVAAWTYSSGDLLEVADQISDKLREVWDSEVERTLSLGMLMLDHLKQCLDAPQKGALQLSSTLCDPHTSLVGKRFQDGYGYATLCGGASGLGSYCYKDVKILTWGPQTSSLGNCEGFGIYSPCYHPYRKQSYTQLSAANHGFSLDGNVKVGAPKAKTISDTIKTVESAEWLKSSQSLSKDRIQIAWNWLKSRDSDSNRHICFFMKACDCQLIKDKLRFPLRSLERYNGEFQPVLFIGLKGKILLSASGPLNMELIPLAGEGDFWGADYLLAIKSPCNHKVVTEWSFLE